MGPWATILMPYHQILRCRTSQARGGERRRNHVEMGRSWPAGEALSHCVDAGGINTNFTAIAALGFDGWSRLISIGLADLS
jgi:hypothetical protein